MKLDEIKPYIIEIREDRYILDIWNPMLSVWNIKINEKEQSYSHGNFLSKMMEFQRGCVEPGDKVEEVSISKDLGLCSIILIKKNNEVKTYQLQPFGYGGNWEIFKVMTNKK